MNRGDKMTLSNVYSWMPVAYKVIGRGAALPPGAVLPTTCQTIGNELMEIDVDISHPAITRIISKREKPSVNWIRSATFVVRDAQGKEYSFLWSKDLKHDFLFGKEVKHEVRFYSPTVVHTVLSGVPLAYTGEPLNLMVRWHIVVNKEKPEFYTYFEVLTCIGTLTLPPKISKISIKIEFNGMPFDELMLGESKVYPFKCKGTLYEMDDLGSPSVFSLFGKKGRNLSFIVSDGQQYDDEGGAAVEILDSRNTTLWINLLNRSEGQPLDLTGGSWRTAKKTAPPAGWRKTFGPLLVRISAGKEGVSPWEVVKARLEEEKKRASEGSFKVFAGKTVEGLLVKNGYDLLNGCYRAEMSDANCQFSTNIENSVVRIRLSNKYLEHSPVKIYGRSGNDWIRSEKLVPSLEFAYPREDYDFGYHEDYAILYVPSPSEVRVEETDHGVRLGHIINSAFLLEVENDTTRHCWNFDNNNMSSGIRGLPATTGPRVLGSNKCCMAGPQYLLWWGGVVYGHGDPNWKVHLLDIWENGPEAIRFHLRSWVDNENFRYDTRIEVPYTTDYNRVKVSLTCTSEISVKAISATYTFRMPIGTEPASYVYERFAYLRPDKTIRIRKINYNDRRWTPMEEISVPGWYALCNSTTGRGNIGVILNHANYTVHTRCLDEEPEFYDEIFLIDPSVPGSHIPKGKKWNLQYEIFTYNDAADYRTVEKEFKKKYPDKNRV